MAASAASDLTIAVEDATELLSDLPTRLQREIANEQALWKDVSKLLPAHVAGLHLSPCTAKSTDWAACRTMLLLLCVAIHSFTVHICVAGHARKNNCMYNPRCVQRLDTDPALSLVAGEELPTAPALFAGIPSNDHKGAWDDVPPPVTELCAKFGIANLRHVHRLLRRSFRFGVNPEAPLVAAPCGVENLGNTCYLASLLQCLYGNPSFRSHVLSWEPPRQDGSGGQQRGSPTMLALRKMFAEMAHGTRSSVSCEAFALALRLSTSRQQDVHEFNQLLLRHLRESMRSVSGRSAVDLFEGRQVFGTVCQACGHSTTRSEPFLELVRAHLACVVKCPARELGR